MSSNRLSRLCTILFLLFICACYSTAQYGDKDFVRYSVKDGLSDNNVTAIQQDDGGYLWVGTEIGLNRYDGYQFKKYYQGHPENFLASSYIRKLYSLGNHRLSILTRNGFQILNTSNNKIQNFFIPDTTAFTNIRNTVWDMKEMYNGSFAMSTASGFYVLDKNGTLAFRHDVFGLSDIGNKRILYGRDIFLMPSGEMLIYAEASKLAHYDVDQKIFRELQADHNKWKDFSHPPAKYGGPWVSKAQISAHEFIFISNSDSIIYYDFLHQKRVVSPLPFHQVDELTWESRIAMIDDSTYSVNGGYSGFHIFHLDQVSGCIIFDPRKFLNSYKINILFQDKEKRLWAGTTQGLLQQILRPGFIKKYNWPIGDFSNLGYVDGLLHKSMLYLARTSHDVGLVIIDTASMQKVNEISFYGKGSKWNEIYSIQMYHPDTLWLGSLAGLLWFDTKSNHYGKVTDQQPLPTQIQSTLMLEPTRQDGYAWMLCYLEGVVARYHIATRTFEVFTSKTKPALPFNKVKGIAYDAFGDVWISGHSLTRWNNREHYFDTLITVYGGSNKYNDDIIVLTADEKGSLWLHNAENGLLEYKIKQKEFVAYSMQDGLPSDIVRCLSPVVDQVLWIGSHNHLTRFDIRTKKMDVFGYQEGLPDQMPIARKMVLSADRNQLYMFYQDEVIRFPVHPKSYPKLSSDLLVQDVIINNSQSFSFPDHTLNLKTKENNVSIHYTIIDFEDNYNYQFAYKLNNANEWISLGQQRNINLNNLSPGLYELHLSATGKSGEQKMKSLSFAIALPFWKSSWFILICALISGGIIYLIYKARIAQFKQKANVDKLLSQTEMKALHAQMNPHFIFNSLNSIREMILNENNKEASRFLSKFAHLIRVTLDQSGQPFISLRNTIDYLERYIEMEKIRNNKFNCQITVDPGLELDETILPPMLIQPFIENAIWHGPSNNARNIDINIQFKKQNDELICIIEDNGIGIEKSLGNKSDSDKMHHSVGISNIRSRIQLLNKKHKLQSSIQVEDKSNFNGSHEHGTRITLRLPLEMAEE